MRVKGNPARPSCRSPADGVFDGFHNQSARLYRHFICDNSEGAAAIKPPFKSPGGRPLALAAAQEICFCRSRACLISIFTLAARTNTESFPWVGGIVFALLPAGFGKSFLSITTRVCFPFPLNGLFITWLCWMNQKNSGSEKSSIHPDCCRGARGRNIIR